MSAIISKVSVLLVVFTLVQCNFHWKVSSDQQRQPSEKAKLLDWFFRLAMKTDLTKLQIPGDDPLVVARLRPGEEEDSYFGIVVDKDHPKHPVQCKKTVDQSREMRMVVRGLDTNVVCWEVKKNETVPETRSSEGRERSPLRQHMNDDTTTETPAVDDTLAGYIKKLTEANIATTTGENGASETTSGENGASETTSGEKEASKTTSEKMAASETTTEKMKASETTTEKMEAIGTTTGEISDIKTASEEVVDTETTTEAIAASETTTEEMVPSTTFKILPIISTDDQNEDKPKSDAMENAATPVEEVTSDDASVEITKNQLTVAVSKESVESIDDNVTRVDVQLVENGKDEKEDEEALDTINKLMESFIKQELMEDEEQMAESKKAGPHYDIKTDGNEKNSIMFMRTINGPSADRRKSKGNLLSDETTTSEIVVETTERDSSEVDEISGRSFKSSRRLGAKSESKTETTSITYETTTSERVVETAKTDSSEVDEISGRSFKSSRRRLGANADEYEDSDISGRSFEESDSNSSRRLGAKSESKTEATSLTDEKSTSEIVAETSEATRPPTSETVVVTDETTTSETLIKTGETTTSEIVAETNEANTSETVVETDETNSEIVVETDETTTYKIEGLTNKTSSEILVKTNKTTTSEVVAESGERTTSKTVVETSEITTSAIKGLTNETIPEIVVETGKTTTSTTGDIINETTTSEIAHLSDETTTSESGIQSTTNDVNNVDSNSKADALDSPRESDISEDELVDILDDWKTKFNYVMYCFIAFMLLFLLIIAVLLYRLNRTGSITLSDVKTKCCG